MTADVTLEQHRQLVKERSRGAWLTHERSLRLREVVYASITFLSLAIALGSVFLAHQYGMSVVVHQNVRDVDRYGQVVAESGSVYRIPAGLAPHALISQFITNVYTVYASGPALQRNYSEAQSLVDSRSDVLPRLKDFWSSYSPLRTDLSWDRSRDTERTVGYVQRRG